MAPRPSVFNGYVELILRAIETTEDNPAQLRSLVYDLARIALGKQVLLAYHQLGSEALREHMRSLEDAISHVESVSLYRLPTPPQITNSDALLAGDVIDERDEPLHPIDINTRFAPRVKILQLPAQATESETWLKKNLLYLWRPLAVLAFFALMAAVVSGISLFQKSSPSPVAKESRTSTPLASSAITLQPNAGVTGGNQQSSVESDLQPHAAGYSGPLPSAYGVYALTGGKLSSLEAMPIRIPDPRVAISAIFPIANPVTVQDGQPKFLVFRRDLVANAPEEVSVRVIARIMQEVKYGGSTPPVKMRVDNEWAVRGKAFGYNVSPVGDRQDMVVISPNTEKALPAGHYALVLKGTGYGFVIDGQDTDPSHCLERTNGIGGTFYSECKKAN